LEVAFAKFVSSAPDVTSFAKNAGPQALRIDYLAAGSRLAFYTPDFFVRTNGGSFLVETKGREDRDVPAKARAAVAWCKAATSKKGTWSYVYVPQGTFERLNSNLFSALVSLCQPALSELLSEESGPQLQFLFTKDQEEAPLRLEEFVIEADFSKLPPRYQQNIRQAVMLYRFIENKDGLSFTPVFTPLIGSLEDASNTLLVERLGPFVPNNKPAQKDFFNPDLSGHDKAKYYQGEIKKLERTIVFRSPISPMGHLKFAIEVGLKAENHAGILKALAEAFGYPNFQSLLEPLNQVYVFRNKFVAHQEKETILSKDVAKSQLQLWVNTLALLHRTRLVEQAILATNLKFGRALQNLAD
jgi:type III restriction enzyme